MSACFELKGSMFTIMVLHLLREDIRDFEPQLDAKIKEAPRFFRNVPVIVDLNAVKDHIEAVDLLTLLDLLRAKEFIPVGIRNGTPEQKMAARQFGLGVFSESRAVNPQPEPEERKPEAAVRSGAPVADASADEAGATEAQASGRSSMLITQPVRSGQQIYAAGSDLIVMSTVSAGAEIISDGHIHVYGALRGRALAGVRGDERARIFCKKLEAELVSVAGQYRVIENFEEGLRGQPAQIFLQENRLKIESL